jgi:lambda family phage portal protein
VPTTEGPLRRLSLVSHRAASLSDPDLKSWLPGNGSADADLNPELGALQSRSRDLTRNHGVASGALQTYVDNIVGTGLRLSALPDWRLLGMTREAAQEWGNETEAHFRAWAESTACDAADSLTFGDMTGLVLRSALYNGDSVALPQWLPRPGCDFATRIQVIESDRLCNPNYQADSAHLRGGIAIDDYGAPQDYWIRTAHPGDIASWGTAGTWAKVPARTPWGRKRVIHLLAIERPGQTRGKPLLSAVMKSFKVLGDYQQAEVKAAVVNAFVALVAETQLGTDGALSMLGGDAELYRTWKGRQDEVGPLNLQGYGNVAALEPGESLKAFSPARPNQAFGPFVESVFRHIAAGLNLPYELLLKDFSKTNYSSARAAMLEAFRFFKGRRKWLSTYWCQPVYELWLEEAISNGAIKAPDFYAKRAAWSRARWIGPGRGWVDPVKEAQGAQIRLESNLTTLEYEAAEQGEDWEEILAQRAREKARMRELGLDPSTTTIAPGAGRTADKSDDEGDEEVVA